MYEFLSARKLADIPIIPLGSPIRVFQTNMEYRKENGPEESGLGNFANFYLRDESQPPYAKVKVDGKEVSNLITFKDNEEISVDYNYFNYPAEITVEGSDGTKKKYRRKWLSEVVRVPCMLSKPTKVDLWDKEAKKEAPKMVEFAKVDFPAGVWYKKLLEKIETVQENSDKDLQLSDFEVRLSYDGTQSPNDMYSVRVKAHNKSLDIETLMENFERRRPEFVPPQGPLL